MFMSCKKDNADASYPTPAPTNAVVQAGDGSVTLSWTAPESENLKEYSITWTPGNGQATVQAGTTLYTATGLTNGTAYTFSIAAVYNNGQKSEVVTKQGTPAASVKPEPTDLVVTPWDKEITLSWQAPRKRRGTERIRRKLDARKRKRYRSGRHDHLYGDRTDQRNRIYVLGSGRIRRRQKVERPRRTGHAVLGCSDRTGNHGAR